MSDTLTLSSFPNDTSQITFTTFAPSPCSMFNDFYSDGVKTFFFSCRAWEWQARTPKLYISRCWSGKAVAPMPVRHRIRKVKHVVHLSIWKYNVSSKSCSVRRRRRVQESDLYGKVVRATALQSSNLNWAINSNKTSDNSFSETFSEYFPNHFVRFNQLSQGAKSTSSNDYVFIREKLLRHALHLQNRFSSNNTREDGCWAKKRWNVSL